MITKPNSKTASFTFEGEILGYFTDTRRTIGEDFKSYVNTTLVNQEHLMLAKNKISTGRKSN